MHQCMQAFRPALQLLALDQQHALQLLVAEQAGLGAPGVPDQQVSGAATLLPCRLSSGLGQQKRFTDAARHQKPAGQCFMIPYLLSCSLMTAGAQLHVESVAHSCIFCRLARLLWELLHFPFESYVFSCMPFSCQQPSSFLRP